MLRRPRDLADQLSNGSAPTTFVLPVKEARNKVRQIINQTSNEQFVPIVENWHQLVDGQIEFTVRTLRSVD
jgi:hypothetical protein